MIGWPTIIFGALVAWVAYRYIRYSYLLRRRVHKFLSDRHVDFRRVKYSSSFGWPGYFIVFDSPGKRDAFRNSPLFEALLGEVQNMHSDVKIGGRLFDARLAVALGPITLNDVRHGEKVDDSSIRPDNNKAIVRRFYEQIDKGNLEALDTVVAEDYIDHGHPLLPDLASGRDGVKQRFKILLEATPGFHRIEDQISERDKVVTRLTFYGKHEGDLPQATRTGNYTKVTSITIHRIEAGKLVEAWEEKD